VGIETLLYMESIALYFNRRDSQKGKTTLALNKGKRDYLNKENLGLSKDPRSKDKGKIPWI